MLNADETLISDKRSIITEEAAFAESCGNSLKDILIGKKNPIELLFPNGSVSAIEGIYLRSPIASIFNKITARVISEALRNIHNGNSNYDILEIGGGTGATTSQVLPALGDRSVNYLFTDISEKFLENGKQKFSSYPFIKYKLFNVEQNPENQGIESSSFDIVLAVNVLHATSSIRNSLNNVHQLLKPDGLFILVEITRPHVWLDLIFGLTEGWWRFNDFDLRPDYPLLNATKWISLLGESGFHVSTIPGNGTGDIDVIDQVLFIAQKKSRSEHERSTEKGDSNYTPKVSPSLTFHPDTETLFTQPLSQHDRIEHFLMEKIAKIMRMELSRLDANIPINTIGFDSIMAVELKNSISEKFGIELKISDILTGSSIKHLVMDISRITSEGYDKTHHSFPQESTQSTADLEDRRPLTSQFVSAKYIIDGKYKTENIISKLAAQVMKLPANQIEIGLSLNKQGLDSIMAVELKNLIESHCSYDIPIADIMTGLSVKELATQISKHEHLSSVKDQQPIVPEKNQYTPFRLTEIQQAYWVGRSSDIHLGGIGAHVYIEFEIKQIDIGRLESSWMRLVERHEMLRAIVNRDGNQQVLPAVEPYNISITDLSDLDMGMRRDKLEQIRSERSHRLFESDKWPLFEIFATKLDTSHTRIHFSIDLMIADAWSLGIIFREWGNYYCQKDIQPEKINYSFRQYLAAEQIYQQTESYRKSKDYWLRRLETLPSAPKLPLKSASKEIFAPRFTRYSSRICSDTWRYIKRIGSQYGLTPSIVMCTRFCEVLGQWSNNRKFTINLTLFNRIPVNPQVNQLVGDFTTLNLLEADMTRGELFFERAQCLQQQLAKDLDHREFNGVSVIRELNRARSDNTQVTMPIVFTSLLGQEESAHRFDTEWLGEMAYGISQTPQVWIDHQVYEQDAGVVLNWDVVEELFPEGMIRDMFDTYCRRLEQLGQSDHAWHERSSELLLPEGHKELFAAINATDAEIAPRLLHTPFEDQARLHPEHLAVITPERSLTYGELYRYSTGLAHQLRQQGARPNELVAVVMEKGWEQVVAVLGILHSGAAYLPIDASLPAQRRATLLEQGRVTTVITQPWLKHSFEWPEGYRLICIDQDFSDTDITALQPLQAPQDLAYVIFTSGSTGVPKGVMIDHRGALNTITDINQRLGVCQRDRVIALSALNFDLSVYDIFGVLAAGATLVIPQAQGLRDPQHWADIMQQHGVTLWNSVPALMQLFMEYAETHPERAPTQLRHVLLSGDWIPLTLPDGLKRCVPGVHVTSLGGATEASIWSIAYPIDRIDPSWSSIPYGKPLTNQRFHVLNERLDPCPIWVPGQLFIGGVGVAQGYWDDPQKSAESFITHPRSGERLYRTGDMGRYLPSGDIEFLGREDNQVKVQGYRIELGEIESALNQHPEVRSGLVLALGPKHGEKRLVGYVVPQRDTSDLKQELKNYLKTKLPPYMVPATYMILDALPLTANGKIDRDALPDPVDEASAPMDLEVIEDDLTQQLLKIVGEVVGIRNTSIKANFFDLGGNSISAMRLVNRIQDSYGIQLPLAMFFHTPTIELLASAIGEQRLAEEQSCVVKLRDGNEKALYCFHPIGGSVFCYRELALQIPLDLPVYGIQAYGLDEKKSPYTNIESMASHYIKEIERIDRQGPYRLLGWSMGATVAYEVAQQLIRKNREVEILAILDAQAPKANRSDIIEDDYADYSELFLADLAGTLDTPINFSKEMFIKKDKKDRISYMLSCIESSIPHTEIDAAIFDRKRMGHLLEIFEANMQALGAYQASPYPGDIIAFRAISQHNSRCNIDDWALLTKNNQLTVVDIPADHYSLLRSNNAQAIANKLSTHME